MRKDLVLYHANCNDGLCSAWLWRRAHPGSTLRSVQYGQSFPWQDLDGHDFLAILDFSYPLRILEKVAARLSGNLIVLDHHKTAARDLEGFPHAVFDMNKSGARLTYEYLQQQGRDPDGGWLVDYTEDRDLWRWRLPDSRAVTAGLNSWPRNADSWDRVWEAYSGPEQLASDGHVILRYQKRVIESMLRPKKIAIVRIGGYAVPCINITDPFLISETVGKLAETHPKHPFAAGYFITGSNQVHYSLRSRSEFDVSTVARTLGGGGHPRAAGFHLDHVLPPV